MPIKQPMGQKLLTNVSVVKLKKGGIIFEIATYPNMVLSWRSGVIKDVSEVLQIERVYKDVEKGEFAKTKDLIKAFGTDDQEEIALEIMRKGELQLSEKERSSQQDSILKEICSVVVEKCINPETKRPVTLGAVRPALRPAPWGEPDCIETSPYMTPAFRLPPGGASSRGLALQCSAQQAGKGAGTTMRLAQRAQPARRCPEQHPMLRPVPPTRRRSKPSRCSRASTLSSARRWRSSCHFLWPSERRCVQGSPRSVRASTRRMCAASSLSFSARSLLTGESPSPPCPAQPLACRGSRRRVFW